MNASQELSYLNVFENQVPLYIEQIKIHTRRFDLSFPFETSFARFDSLIRLFPEITFRTESGDLVTGRGECSPLSAPWYDYECHRSVGIALSYIISALTGKPVEEIDGLPVRGLPPFTDIISFLDRFKWIVGHNMAKSGVEGAYWDAVAQIHSVSVSKLWGGTRKSVSAGTSVGLEPTIEAFIRKIDIAIGELNVSRVKVKVKPGKDVTYIEAVRRKYPDIKLQVDANACYDLFNPVHVAILKEFDNYNLLMIEQPGRNDDILDHSRQLSALKTPVCLDESILNEMHTRQAIELWRQNSDTNKLIINIKPPRVGGFLESIRIAKMCHENGVSVWCGGMYETALGKTSNIHFCSREEVNLPGDHISQAPYFKVNVADSPEYEDGVITVPEGIGWGLKNFSL
ncbi:MAG: o-succinylbenzoate synthase [Bacteroidetes bacterium]|nr:o-succinylbenzoate synthase [Bacteroidota bacterium]